MKTKVACKQNDLYPKQLKTYTKKTLRNQPGIHGTIKKILVVCIIPLLFFAVSTQAQTFKAGVAVRVITPGSSFACLRRSWDT